MGVTNHGSAMKADFSADGPPTNPVLYEEGGWRLYGHSNNEFSYMAHKCLERPGGRAAGVIPRSTTDDTLSVWRWFWGAEACQNCHEPIPDEIKGLYLLHNFDRMSEMT